MKENTASLTNKIQKRGNLTSQLFSYKEWDEACDYDAVFYEVELKVDIGEYKAGKKFAFCNWCESHSVVEFFENISDEVGVVFGLSLVVEKL